MLDADRLRKSWTAVAGHGDQVPLFFYSTLFLMNPDVREMFPLGMAGQRDRLVGALGRAISQVDDLESVVPMLQQLGRDHRRFGVGPEHYPAVREALLATLEHFGGAEWSEELTRDWTAAYGIVADVMTRAANDAAALPPWWELTVRTVERPCFDVAVLTVTPHAPLPYVAGQSIAVEIPTRPRVWRYYSPATLPTPDGAFELHVRLVPGGPVSSAIVQGVRPGDVLRAGAPVGERLTVPPGPGPGLLLLAGGTGVAPMKALVDQMAAEGGPRPVELVWGVHFRRELYDLPALRELTGRLDGAELVPCVSREDVGGPGLETGTVIDVALRRGTWSGRDVYICGSPSMVAATAQGVLQAGATPDRVHVEEFGSEETGT